MLVGLLSAVGLTFLLTPRWLLPLTAGLLLVALAYMAREARRRGTRLPLAVAVIAAGGMLLGKFRLESDFVMFGSMALLALASIWNGIAGKPRRGGGMSHQTVYEVFSAGCPACDDVIGGLSAGADPSWEVRVLDMHDPEVARRAEELGIRSVPAVVVDGRLADCCQGRGVDLDALREAGRDGAKS